MPTEKNLGIIDFECKGNVVRFYIGDTKQKYWGDDWDDRPYEDNAGKVYDQFIDHAIDIAFPFDVGVFEPNTGRYTKQDMINKKVPCVIIVPADKRPNYIYHSFDEWANDANTRKFYFGDKINVDENFNISITHEIETKLIMK